MNSKELQSIRKMLMLDVSEAAELIGHVSKRSWQYWESGRSPVPSDVENAMNALIERRSSRMDEIEASLEGLPPAEWNLQLKYHQSFDEYQVEHPGSTAVDWRIEQSVAAAYFADGLAVLV